MGGNRDAGACMGSVRDASLTRLPALSLTALLLLTAVAKAAEPLDVKIGYLRRPQHRETISLLRMPARDDGLAGAEMAVKDNDTTGHFLNQRFSLIDLHLTDGADVAAAVGHLAGQGVSLVVTDLPATVSIGVTQDRRFLPSR